MKTIDYLFSLFFIGTCLLLIVFNQDICHAEQALSLNDLLIQRTCQNISKINSYKGIVIQKGLVAHHDLKAEVLFKKPYLFLSTIIAPQELNQICVLYKESLLLYYFPTINWAIRIHHFYLPTTAQLETIISDSYKKNVNNYDYTFGASSSIANLPVIEIQHKAKTNKMFNISGKTFIYDHYSFPLAGKLLFKGNHEYAYSYQKIDFNIDLPDQLFTVKLPDKTIVSEWDLKAPQQMLSDIKKKANFSFSLPEKNSFGLKRSRIIEQKGIVPAFAVIYEKEPYFLIVMMVRDYGLGTNDVYGIPIQTTKKGRLIISPLISSFSFIHNETVYTLMGNLPFEDLLLISDDIH